MNKNNSLTLRAGIWKTVKKQKYHQFFVLPGILFLFIFSYIPMFGIIMAFKNYDVVDGISGIFTSKWVGLKNFIEFVNELDFLIILRNTFAISILKLIFAFPIPIIFAIVLNESKGIYFKRLVQTASYLPHFVSWVIVSGIVITFLSFDGGLINTVLQKLHLQKIPFLTEANYFWGIAVITDIWKEFGWGAIIFIAAITGIDISIYEAASIDGAGRLKRIWHITLPGIKGAVGVVLILTAGSLMGGNFDQSYLLGNAFNMSKSDIIPTYVVRVGLSQMRVSFATAIGLLQSVFSVIMVFGSNYLSKKFIGSSLY